MKAHTIVLWTAVLLATLTSCGGGKSPPSEKDIQADLNGNVDFLTTSGLNPEIGYEVTKVVVDRRKTDKEHGSDEVYATITSTSAYGEYTAPYFLYYTYYDEGGWYLEYGNQEETGWFKAITEPTEDQVRRAFDSTFTQDTRTPAYGEFIVAETIDFLPVGDSHMYVTFEFDSAQYGDHAFMDYYGIGSVPMVFDEYWKIDTKFDSWQYNIPSASQYETTTYVTFHEGTWVVCGGEDSLLYKFNTNQYYIFEEGNTDTCKMTMDHDAVWTYVQYDDLPPEMLDPEYGYGKYDLGYDEFGSVKWSDLSDVVLYDCGLEFRSPDAYEGLFVDIIGGPDLGESYRHLIRVDLDTVECVYDNILPRAMTKIADYTMGEDELFAWAMDHSFVASEPL